MNVHDWARVDDGTFHDFHNSWIVHLKEALNEGLLPKDFYAQGDRHIGRKAADVLTLHASDPNTTPLPPLTDDRAVAVAESPPRVSRTRVLKAVTLHRPRTVVIRTTAGHRIVALIEIISPANKASADGVREFVEKVTTVLRGGIHVVVLDVLRPGRHDPKGMHEAVLQALGDRDDEIPSDKPLTFVSYVAEAVPTAHLQHFALGDSIPDQPLFLTSERYVELPLGATYAAAFQGVPEVFRDILDRPA